MNNLVYTYLRRKTGKIKGFFSVFSLAGSAIENSIASYALLPINNVTQFSPPFTARGYEKKKKSARKNWRLGG